MMDVLFQGPAIWFSIPALTGTVLFVLRLGLLMLGGGDHGDLGGGHDAGGHHDTGDAHEGSGLFKAVSLQAIAAFAMGFGWGGLGALKGADASPIVSMAVGFAGGLLTAVILTLLMRSVRKLETSGNVSMAQAVGSEGEVYTTVPAKGEGRGQVTLIVSGKQRTFNAVSDSVALPTASRVRVIRVHADHSLVVAPV